MWLNNLWLVLERLVIDSWIHSTISTEARNGDGVIWQRSLRTLLSQYWINVIYMRGPPSFWECYTSRNTSRLALKGQRWDKMRGFQTTKNLQATNRLIKLQTCAILQCKGSPIRPAGTGAQIWEQKQKWKPWAERAELQT